MPCPAKNGVWPGSAGLTRAVLEFVASVPALMDQHRAAILQIYIDKVTPGFPCLCSAAFSAASPVSLVGPVLVLLVETTLSHSLA